MNDALKLGLAILAIIIVGGIIVKLLAGLMGLLIPIAIVAAIVLIGYGIFSRKSLGGGRGRLP